MSEREKLSLTTSLTCFGLELDSKSPLLAPGLISIFGKGQKTIKKEKRYIKLYQSSLFTSASGGKPTSMVYDTIYQSDVIENDTNIKPSLTATISCPLDYNCKIRLYVYYSSNLTNGKDILLAGTSFEFQDLLKSKGLFLPTAQMFSEHCLAASASVLVLDRIPTILTDPEFSIINSSTERNPLSQNYVFYNPDDSGKIPRVYCEEITFEPRLSTKVALEYLKNVKTEIRRSSKAWRERYLLERMRQGNFKSLEEAFDNGWVELKVTVIGSHMNLKNIKSNKLKIFALSEAKLRNTLTNNPVVNKLNIEIPSSEEFFAKKRSSIFGSSQILEFPEKFNSYFDIICEKSDKNFCRKLGDTNIEYQTDIPVYGSNLNASLNHKPVTGFSPSSASWSTIEPVEYDAVAVELKGENSVSRNIKLAGGITSLFMYIPDENDLNVRLQLHASNSNAKNSFSKVGYCSVDISDYSSDSWRKTSSKDKYEEYTREFCVPLQLYNPDYTGKADIVFSVSMKRPFSKQKVDPMPYNFPSINLCHLKSETKKNDKVTEITKSLSSSSVSNDAFESYSSKIMIDDKTTLGVCYDWLVSCGMTMSDPLLNKNTSHDYCDSPNIYDNRPVGKNYQRLDIPYPLDWLESHIMNLDNLLIDMDSLIEYYEDRIATHVNFRRSALKKNDELQALPINLLGQLMVVKELSNVKSADSSSEPTGLYNGLTCGSMAVHSKSHKKIGITSMEQNIQKEIDNLNSKKKFLSTVLNGRSSIEALVDFNEFLSVAEEAKKLTTSIESEYLALGHRRILCISQALSIVVNGLVMKLNLVAEKHILPSFAENWVTYGLVVVFEGLLSVSGKERIMLEDSFAVIETVRSFHVRILPLPVEMEGDSKVTVDINRFEVRLYIPLQTLEKLPLVYARKAIGDGVIINLVTVLFTQGIDIMQSIATTFSADSSQDNMNSGDLQKFMNFKSFQVLNSHCHLVQQVDSSTGVEEETHIHPIMRSLYTSVYSTSPNVKDVRMLREAELICDVLGGLRVTFCKSGKDRTGMAATLEQARFIGERFGCGFSEEVLLKNVNIMRLHGTRLAVAEKNIGKPIFSINKIQASFLPTLYRPPPQVQENILKNGDSS